MRYMKDYYCDEENRTKPHCFFDKLNLLHNENGPARIYPSGRKEYWIHGNLHREDGPAIEWDNGRGAPYLIYYWAGQHFDTEEEWLTRKFIGMIERGLRNE